MKAAPMDTRNRVLAALVSVFLLAPGRATAGQTNALESLKSSQDMAQLEIGATCVQREKDALKQYGKSLDALLVALKQKGDLDAYLVVESEKKRVSVEGTVPADKDTVPALADAVRTYRKAVANAATERDQQTVSYLKKYVTALDGLIKKEMAADRIEQAKRVKAEKDKVALVLADLQTRLPVKAVVDTDSKRPSVEKAGTAKTTSTLPAGLLKGCVLYYSFDKDEGEEVTDQSGRQNNGRLKGAVLVSSARGPANAACDFKDGTSLDTASGDDSVSAFEELTLATWVKLTTSSGIQHIVGRTDGGTTFQTPGSFGLVLGHDGVLLPTFHFNDGGDVRLSFGRKIGTEKWYHLVAVLRPNGTAAGYIDGVRVLLKSGFRQIPALPNAFFRVGSWGNGTYSYRFSGLLDDVRIYRRALSDSEVKQLYAAQKR